MFRTIFFIIFISVSCFSFTQNIKVDVSAKLFFGSGFGINNNVDTISFKVGSAEIYNQYKLYSVKSYGQANGGLLIFNIKKRLYGIDTYDNIYYLAKSRFNKLKLSFLYRNIVFTFEVDFKNGKYLIVDSKDGKLLLSQFDEEPVFM